jgi:N-acyl homoserine lactone hydrolase
MDFIMQNSPDTHHSRNKDPQMKEIMMSQNAVNRLYLMQVGSMPKYQIPIVCYLVQTNDGKNILIDSGLPEVMPEGESDFENGQDVIQQLASIGLKPDDIDTVISTHYDIDHAGRHAAFTKAQYVVQRVHHLDADSNPRFADIRPQWDQPMGRIRMVDGDTELLPGLDLIETSGHVPGNQSVLIRLPKTGAILLTIDAVAFKKGFTRDEQDDVNNPDAEATRASTIKLLDLVELEQIELVIFGHENEQWQTLKKAPEFYE